MLKISDRAPDFALPDQNGNIVKLSDVLKKSNAVIFFYPKDHTPGCTEQSCSFRDNQADFFAHNAQVIGISTDSAESHQSFATKFKLPFPLLTDTNGDVGKAFGLVKKFGIIPSRVTFVVDRQGLIRDVTSNLLQVQAHIDNALRSVKEIEKNE